MAFLNGVQCKNEWITLCPAWTHRCYLSCPYLGTQIGFLWFAELAIITLWNVEGNDMVTWKKKIFHYFSRRDEELTDWYLQQYSIVKAICLGSKTCFEIFVLLLKSILVSKFWAIPSNYTKFLPRRKIIYLRC